MENQKGFALIESLLIILILAVIGFGGYYVWHTQKGDKSKSGPHVTSENAAKPVSPAPASDNAMLTLADSTVSLTYPKNEWVADTSAPSGPGGLKLCGQAVISDAQCKDFAAFYLAKEGITDSDHFYVSVGVFDTGNSTTAKDFLNYVGDILANGDGSPATTSQTTINGNPAYYLQADYGSDGQDLYWAILGKNEGVVVSTVLFSGNHYSYQTTNNYFTYKPDVENIVSSIKITD